jgi:hypothetical protein
MTALPTLPDEDLCTNATSIHCPSNCMSVSPPPHILTPDEAPLPEMLDASGMCRAPFEEDGQELGASGPSSATPTPAPNAALQFSGAFSPEFQLLYQALTDQMGAISVGLSGSLAVITTCMDRLEGASLATPNCPVCPQAGRSLPSPWAPSFPGTPDSCPHTSTNRPPRVHCRS